MKELSETMYNKYISLLEERRQLLLKHQKQKSKAAKENKTLAEKVKLQRQQRIELNKINSKITRM